MNQGDAHLVIQDPTIDAEDAPTEILPQRAEELSGLNPFSGEIAEHFMQDYDENAFLDDPDGDIAEEVCVGGNLLELPELGADLELEVKFLRFRESNKLNGYLR